MDYGVVLSWTSLVLALVAIPLTYVWGRRSRRQPDLRYAKGFDVLLNTSKEINPRPLRVSLGAQDIERVSRTFVAVWNHRGDTVRGQDIVEADRLRVKVGSGDMVLQASLISASRDACGVSVSVGGKDRSEVGIEFDFLDEGDGFLLEVVHRGTESAQLAGTIRGVRLRPRASIELTPEALRSASESSVWRRYKMRRSPNRRALDVAFLGLTFVATLVFVVALDPWRSPEVVPVGSRDLASLDGQFAFCKAVADRGLVNRLVPWVLALYPVLGASMWLQGFVPNARRIVPAPIVLSLGKTDNHDADRGKPDA